MAKVKVYSQLEFEFAHLLGNDSGKLSMVVGEVDSSNKDAGNPISCAKTPPEAKKGSQILSMKTWFQLELVDLKAYDYAQKRLRFW